MKSICTNPCCSTRENVILQEIKLNNLILGDGGELVVPRDAFYSPIGRDVCHSVLILEWDQLKLV